MITQDDIEAMRPVMVCIVRWFSAEEYSNYEGVDKVFSTMEAAKDYLAKMGRSVHGENLEEHEYGYFLSERIEEYEVNS